MPRWRRLAVLVLAAVAAGWMLFDGARALLVGDYLRSDGQLGPWAPLVEAIGVDPMSFGMRAFFVLFGAAWLGACAWFALDRPRGRALMIGFAAASLWYLVFGTVLSLALLALLLVPSRARDER